MRARLLAGLSTALTVAVLGACAAPHEAFPGLPLVDRDDQAAYEARLATWRKHAASGFAAYDRDGNGAVSFGEWVEANYRRALVADLDRDGALDRYEALLYRDVPQRRDMYGQAAVAEFSAFWRAYEKGGKLRKPQLAAYFRSDFEVGDLDRDGALQCREMLAPGAECPQPGLRNAAPNV